MTDLIGLKIVEEIAQARKQRRAGGLCELLHRQSKLRTLLVRHLDELLATARRAHELKIELQQWQDAFGTTQSSTALAERNMNRVAALELAHVKANAARDATDALDSQIPASQSLAKRLNGWADRFDNFAKMSRVALFVAAILVIWLVLWLIG